MRFYRFRLCRGRRLVDYRRRLCVCRSVVGTHRCGDRLEAELTFVLDPGEHLFDRLAPGRRSKLEIPAQPAFFGLQCFEVEIGAADDTDLELSQRLQLAEHAQWIVAGFKNARAGPETNCPAGAGLIRTDVRRRGRVLPIRFRGSRFAFARGRSGVLLQHGLELRLELLGTRRVHVAAGQAGNHLADTIHRLQQQVDAFARYRPLALAHFVEQRFDVVRKLGDFHEAESCAAALDRMGRAKDCIHRFGVRGAEIEVQQPGFHDVQPLEAFLDEELGNLRHVYIDRHLKLPLKFRLKFPMVPVLINVTA